MKPIDPKQTQAFANTIVVGIAVFFVGLGFATSGFTSEVSYITAILLLFILLLAKFQIQNASAKDLPATKLTKLLLVLIAIGFIAAVIYLNTIYS